MIFAIYLLKVILCSGLLLGYYWLALRNRIFHQWNRFYLLAAVLLSLVLPLLQFSLVFQNDQALQAVRYISVASLDESVVVMAKQKPFISFSVEQWLLLAYAFISAVLLALTLNAAKGILNIFKSHSKERINGINFIKTAAPGTPFSIFNYLVWNRNIDLTSDSGQYIFRHELAHISQRHTLDKLFLILVLIPFWCNPFFWIIRRELNDIHEFIADEEALKGGNAKDLSRMILNALYPQQTFLFTSPFFQSSIKRRLQMFNLQNQKINYMSRILALPVILAIVASFTIKQADQKEKETFLHQISQKDTVPENVARGGFYADTRNKIYLEADEIVSRSSPDKTNTGPKDALLIVDGKKMDNRIWESKTIVSKKLVFYPKNDPEAIRLYGSEAAKGTLVFVDAKIIDKAESELYKIAERDTVPKEEKDSRVFTKVEVEPKFAGDWSKFLQQHLNPVVPVNNGAPAGQYTVIAQFIVDTEGNISDLKTLTKHGYGMEEEVLRVMKLSPNWIPAMQNGRKVTAYRKQPITFVISEEESETTTWQDIESNPASQKPVKFDPPVLKKVDVEAKFKGDWASFLQQHLNPKVPADNKAPVGRHTAIVQFVVEKNGEVRAIKPVTKLGYGMEEEIIRVMKLSPKWEPAKVNGKDVSAIRKQPITFIVSGK